MVGGSTAGKIAERGDGMEILGDALLATLVLLGFLRLVDWSLTGLAWMLTRCVTRREQKRAS